MESGSGAVDYVRLAAYARRSTPERPYGVANDYVASALGVAMGAPVPPSTLVLIGPDEWGHVSLGFGEHGAYPPPVDFEELAARRPWEATGILVLDQWVCNNDRHDQNVGYLESYGVAAFDHDCALFGPKPKEPVRALQVAMDSPVRGHHLASELQTSEYIEGWIRRARAVTKEEIRRLAYACSDARLLTADERDQLVQFLLHRQSHLRAYIEETRSEFTRIAEWTLPEGGAE